MDDSGTTGTDGRWLTYAELAELRGITRKAAIRLTQRHQWRRQPGNDGATRVFVSCTALCKVADKAGRQTPRDGGTPDPKGANGTFDAAAFTEALAAIREAHAGEVTALRAQLTASQDATRKAQEALDAFRQADADRKARRVLARLRAAWRGE